MNSLVLITGTGRSGTSTMSGTLHHLGLHVPGPYLGANESNPKGFFESRWAVKFHNRITADAGIHIFDGRPGAFEKAQAAITPAQREKLVGFLRKRAEEGSQIVVKDPRSVWTQGLWRDAAAEVGLEIRYITMLRHPAEVIGSRSTYYASKTDEAKRQRYEIFNVARWINGSLISERETRGEPRAFVRYSDLLEDWRPAVARLGQELGLTYNADLATGEHHPVDDFIDAGLRRHQVTWDELQVPDSLRAIAQQVWNDLMVLGDSAGVDAKASEDLDRQAELYAALLAESA
ncbi:sulfotransferase family protein, partial [Nocardioides sp.]|uniref:sulfotransferase family protein n=1 Tax=Nocardioides sp. TaxID=35761 RepID=UPI002734BBB7